MSPGSKVSGKAAALLFANFPPSLSPGKVPPFRPLPLMQRGAGAKAIPDARPGQKPRCTEGHRLNTARTFYLFSLAASVFRLVSDIDIDCLTKQYFLDIRRPGEHHAWSVHGAEAAHDAR